MNTLPPLEKQTLRMAAKMIQKLDRELWEGRNDQHLNASRSELVQLIDEHGFHLTHDYELRRKHEYKKGDYVMMAGGMYRDSESVFQVSELKDGFVWAIDQDDEKQPLYRFDPSEIEFISRADFEKRKHWAGVGLRYIEHGGEDC